MSASHPVPGYVYILSNPSMPGIFKVGMSSKSGRVRADELYRGATGVPTPFNLEFEIYASDARITESDSHDRLSKYRINQTREFFRAPLDAIVRCVCSAALSDYERIHVVDDRSYFYEDEAALIVDSTGLAWGDVVDAICSMSDCEILLARQRSLYERFNTCRIIYGDRSEMTRRAEWNLTEFNENSKFDSILNDSVNSDAKNQNG